MKTLVGKILRWLNPKCPKCKEGVLMSIFLDMEFDKIVWRCDKCKKEFI